MRLGERRDLVSLALISLVAAGFVLALVGWIMFFPTRPNTSGPYAVGRLELMLSGSHGQRIPVTAWYPTIGPPGGQATHNAPPSTQTPTPLILYSSGWAGTRLVSSIQTENLASHGFVVVACDDYANDIAADSDHGEVFDLSSDTSTAATRARGDRHVARQATILLEILHALGAGEAGPLSGRINLARIGVLGYSIGGAAGVEAATRDGRIVAVFNVDGWLVGPSADSSGHGSYFLLSSNELLETGPALASPNPVRRNEALLGIQAYERNARRTERAGSYWIRLNNTDHEDLSDRLFALTRRKIFRLNAERRDINNAIARRRARARRSCQSASRRVSLERLGDIKRFGVSGNLS